MNKVRSHNFSEYKLNITKYATLRRLSLAMLGFWFKENNHRIK
jgi:hypothetical protein